MDMGRGAVTVGYIIKILDCLALYSLFLHFTCADFYLRVTFMCENSIQLFGGIKFKMLVIPNGFGFCWVMLIFF